MVTNNEAQHARDYGPRTTEAVKSVLLEIGQILGSYQGKFIIVGGSVPWLLLAAEDMQHVGTMDVDIALSAEALGDGEYAQLVESLLSHGYHFRDGRRKFQLHRTVPSADGTAAIDVVIDFLMPKDAAIVKNNPPLVDDFAVIRASGADLAVKYFELVPVHGNMPGGGTNKVEIAVCSIPAFLAMKGHAMHGRHKQKDAYDIYYCVRNYPNGIDALAEKCMELLSQESGKQGYTFINQKFDTVEGYGPSCVKNFVSDSGVLDGRTPAEWQQDAYGQVDALMHAMRLRE
ncbi:MULTISPECIES: nucleotidyl transferase AbiEii/AbiGii toxin family protein [unclassified Janthinobacterium]|uniref:nucleotidyl transferase AbiEii/AbiGii toxin family protein n=1 Tax=unclassified Janthinobacterium TaxID=2610881 RepID=UPI00162180CC|nr:MULTISPECIES: nucleotidyl transferase AbiEii/AbiGii toxin family protein [unclassified Janthinobacterium]MBB5607914.1 hypothetical protein [Janthinobacterium sp. S3T4]MBB5613345.1 hypothetical protein [Janthinobacterium sp. S3M3]